MNEIIKQNLSYVFSILADRLVSAESVQTILKCVTVRIREMTDSTETPIDDILLSFLEGIAASYDKADAIAAWIQDALIPNRCRTEEEAHAAKAELSVFLSERKPEYLEYAAYFVGTILPILAAYYRRGGKDEDET